jgi:hypothetical protein
MFALFVTQVGAPDPGWVGVFDPKPNPARVESGSCGSLAASLKASNSAGAYAFLNLYCSPLPQMFFLCSVFYLIWF